MCSLKTYWFDGLLNEDDLQESIMEMYDVQFNILDKSGAVLGSLKSHKFLLSLLSPVLRKVFFHGPVEEEKGISVVEIKGILMKMEPL